MGKKKPRGKVKLPRDRHGTPIDVGDVLSWDDGTTCKVDTLTFLGDELGIPCTKEHAGEQFAELQAKVDELTAERDALKSQLGKIIVCDTATDGINRNLSEKLDELTAQMRQLEGDLKPCAHCGSEGELVRHAGGRERKING